MQADKGGAILIVYPELLRKTTMEKLNNPTLYEQIDKDPNSDLYKELNNLWVSAKSSGLVSPKDAKEVVGISDNPKSDGSGPTNHPTTLPVYKPGKPYFYPSLKIHKLSKDALVPRVEPPIRLITALQEEVTKRSDVFLCEKYLRPLELGFCSDLLQDTNDALRWLDDLNDTIDHNTIK